MFRVRAVERKIDKNGHYIHGKKMAWRYPSPEYVQIPVILEFIKSCDEEIHIQWEWKDKQLNLAMTKEFIHDAQDIEIENELREFIEESKGGR